MKNRALAFFVVLLISISILFFHPCLSSFSARLQDTEKWTIYSNIGDVSSIVFTPNYMWIGTSGGLVKWDIQDKTYKKLTTIDGLGDNRIERIYPDSSGNLWIGNYNALTKYDGKKFEVYLAKDILADKWIDYEGKPIGRQLKFPLAGQDEDGSLWFNAGTGISKFTKQGWIHRDLLSLLPQEYGYVTSFGRPSYIFDSKNRLWVTHWKYGVCLIDSLNTEVFTKDDGLAGNDAIAILEDSDGNIWIGHRWNGLSKFDGKDWVVFDTSDGLASNWVYLIYEDNQRNIWLGTSRGICRYDGNYWNTFYRGTNLWAWDFVTDENEKLWAATSKGIRNWNGNTWEIFDYHPDDPLTDNWVITGAMDYEGNLWFAARAGVCVFDGKQWQKYPLSTDRVNAILPLKTGEVWAGMRGGAVTFSNGEGKIYTRKYRLQNKHVLSIAQDLDGRLWFGTEKNGLTCLDGDKWKSYTTADGLLANCVHSIAVDSKGMLWCATSLGISTYDGSIWKSYTADDGLPEEGVFYITFDSEGTLWFASYGGGIGSFDGSLWKRITMEDGLPDNSIYSVTPDDNGRIWVATENGGACVIQNDTWRIITPEDGLPCRYVRKVLIDKQGAIWFATGAGIGKLQGFEGVPTAVVASSDRAFVPTGYALAQNYPNPFNALTTIAYDLPKASDVTLTIYTITGQKVAVLVDTRQQAGPHRILFDGSGFATGIYLYHLKAGGFVQTRRMVLLK